MQSDDLWYDDPARAEKGALYCSICVALIGVCMMLVAGYGLLHESIHPHRYCAILGEEITQTGDQLR